MLYGDPPELTSLSFECYKSSETWILDAQTEGWTANGTLYLTLDGIYAEQHSVKSIEAAADGSSDHLSLSLAIESDWQAASSGSSTAFLCTESVQEGLTGCLFVYTPGTSEPGDCECWGDPELLELLDVPSCS